jgi:hypothetical protein
MSLLSRYTMPRSSKSVRRASPSGGRRTPAGSGARGACRRLLLELLEDRTLLSATNPFYNLTTLASTGGSSLFTSFGDLPSINNRGDVAFVGNTSTGNGLWIAGRNGTLANITPTFSGNNDGRTYGRQASINDNDQVVARDQLGTQYLVRRWTGTIPDQHVDLFHTPVPVQGSPDNHFASAQTFTAINNNGDIAFVAYDAAQAARYVEKEFGNNIADGTYTPVLTTDATGAKASPRPQLTNNGRVLYVTPNGNLYLASSATNREFIAGARNGFKSISLGAGVSKDGRIIVFSGDRGRGPGLFAAYQSGGGRVIVRIAGEGVDGFTAFDATGNVVVNTTDVNFNDASKSQRGVTLAFEGTSALGTGIYSTRLSLFGDAANDFDPSDPKVVTVSGIVPVALDGANFSPGVTISDVELGDGINDIGRGEIAFWAKTSDGDQEILLAEPQQVVWVNFDPQPGQMAGLTGQNLALMNEVGVTDYGFHGSFQTCLENIGVPDVNAAYENAILDAVQAAYDGAHASVRVLGRAGETVPAYVPYVLTNEDGQPIDSTGQPVGPGQQPVTFGAYQTVLVGGNPVDIDGNPVGPKDENGNTIFVAGMASQAYPVAGGGVDFFNQIQDDTAVVFADTIFRSNAFPPGTDPSTIDPQVRINAVADTIAHETGHNFGLSHLDPSLSAQLMHGGTNRGEFDSAQIFDTAGYPLDQLGGVTESSANRLHFATNGLTSEPPAPALLALAATTSRAKIAATLTGPSLNVAHLIAAVVPAGAADQLPVFTDLGGGDFATLLAGVNLAVSPGDKIMILGSTDGTSLNIVGVSQGQEGAQNGLSRTMLGLATDGRLAAPVSGSRPGLHFYELTSTGSVDLGTAAIQTSAVNHAPVLSPIANQAVAFGSTVTFTASATDPDAGQALTYTLAAGAPLGARIDPASGAFTWTPTAAQAGQVYNFNVVVTDNGTPAQSAAQSVTINILNRLQAVAVTELTTPNPGPMQVAVDFNEALQPTPAQAASNYRIVSQGGISLPIQSAVYSDSGTQHRVVLTVAAGAKVVPDVYHVSIDAANLTATNGDLGAPKADQLWVDVTSENTLKPIAVQPDGSYAVSGSGFNLGYGPPQYVIAGNFAGNGRADLVVATSAVYDRRTTINSNDHLLYDPLLLLKSNGDGTYAPPVPIALGSGFKIDGLRSVDWNHDGSPDLVVAVEDQSSEPYGDLSTIKYYYYVLINDGHGNFTNAPETPIRVADATYANPTFLSPFEVYDLNDSGQYDIIRLGNGQTSNGDATLEVIGKDQYVGYTPQMELDAGRGYPVQWAFADLNGDGKPDIIIGYGGYYGGGRALGILLSTPTGYAAPTNVLVTPNPPSFLGVGAFTGVGQKDIAVVYDNYSNSLDVHDGDVIQILQNDGKGNFTAQMPIILNRRDVALTSFADVNNDGIPDLVMILTPSTGQYGSNGHVYDHVSQLSVWTWAADGHGGFAPTTAAPVPLATTDESAPSSITLTDVDGDHYPDLVLGSNQLSHVRLAINDGTGTMRPPPSALPFTGIVSDGGGQLRGLSSQVFADFNNSGQMGFVAITLRGLEVYVGQPGGGFLHTASLPSLVGGLGWDWVKVCDLNNDGIPDIVYGVSNIGGPMGVYLGIGDGTFRPGPTPVIAVPAGYKGINNVTLVDVNHDGKLDAVCVLTQQSGVYVSITAVAVFFGDGKGNLVFNLSTVVPYVAFGAAPTPVAIPTLADFNGDGKLDLLVPAYDSSTGSTTLTLYLGNGNGTFTPGATVFSGRQDNEFLVGDFNGDGKLDIVTYYQDSPGLDEESSTTLHFYFGDGQGRFAYQPNLDLVVGLTGLNQSGVGPANLVLGDFNGDGKLDLAASFYEGYLVPDKVAVYTGDGTGHFAAPQFITVGTNPFTLDSIPRAPFLDAGTFAVTDQPPTASNVTPTVVTGSSIDIPVLNYVTNPDGAPLTITSVSNPAHGTVHILPPSTPTDPTGETIIYVPTGGYTGTDSFTYTVADAAGVEATATVAVTITPAPLPPQVAFSAAAYSVAENAGSVTITVTRAGDTTGTETVQYATRDGTAAAGTNYTAASGTLTFGPGETSKTFTVGVRDDGVADGDKTVQLTLTNATGGTLGSPATAVLTITNTDVSGGGGGQVQFAAAAYSVGENGSAVTITVSRMGASTGTETVQYATRDGTATAGTSYTAASGTLTFGPGETSKTFTIGVRDDGVADGDKTLQLTLSNATGGTLGSPATAVVTIADTDTSGVPNGPPSPKLIEAARAFAHSKEHYTQFVVGAYQQYLKRTPDPVGLGFWVSNMQAGVYTDEQVEAFFIGSQEYIASHGGTGQAWVTGMYKDLLGRDPRPDEVDRWVAALNGGTPPDAVAHGFAASPERESQRVRFNYNTYLGRPAQQAEVDEWVNAFVGGITNEDMVAGFVGSPEYYQNPQKGKGNEARWVAQAYLDVLFRAAGAGEIDFWVRFLDS